MSETVAFLNTSLAIGGLLLIPIVLLVFFDLQSGKRLKSFIERWGMLIAFLVATGSSIMTLIYSEVFGFVPCGLCWLQRVFLYPLIMLTGVSLLHREKLAAWYGTVLALAGLIVALYHHYLQMGGSALVACPQSGADCMKRYLFEFGFVTFPLLSAILFATLIVLFWYVLRTKESQ